MNKKQTALVSVFIIIVFMTYIIYDIFISKDKVNNQPTESSRIADTTELKWQKTEKLQIQQGKLKSITVTGDNKIITGGETFLVSYNNDLSLNWSVETPGIINCICSSGDTIFAATNEIILLYNKDGEKITEWGPYENNCIITGISSNGFYLAFADAGNKMVFVLGNTGELLYFFGNRGERFIIPSPYFDVTITPDNKIIVANTGKRRIEFRTLEGEILNYFGEAGIAHGEFCGCCNPSHFVVLSDNRLATSEKGLNRIKIYDFNGNFIEYVIRQDYFNTSTPLDIAADKEGRIYAANPEDFCFYIFESNQWK